MNYMREKNYEQRKKFCFVFLVVGGKTPLWYGSEKYDRWLNLNFD